MKMYAWYALAICLVLGWAGQKSVNGEPAAANTSPAITGNRPVWYNGPTGTSLVYQQRSAHSASAGESRAFLSPVYYAPAVPPVSVTTTAQPAQAAPKAEKKFDLSTFFDKLKRVNEKYANRKPTVGTQKQLNGDAEEAAKTNAVRSYDLLDDGGVEPTEGEDRTEWDNNETAAEAINEGMLIVTKMCDIKIRIEPSRVDLTLLASCARLSLPILRSVSLYRSQEIPQPHQVQDEGQEEAL